MRPRRAFGEKRRRSLSLPLMCKPSTLFNHCLESFACHTRESDSTPGPSLSRASWTNRAELTINGVKCNSAAEINVKAKPTLERLVQFLPHVLR